MASFLQCLPSNPYEVSFFQWPPSNFQGLEFNWIHMLQCWVFVWRSFFLLLLEQSCQPLWSMLLQPLSLNWKIKPFSSFSNEKQMKPYKRDKEKVGTCGNYESLSCVIQMSFCPWQHPHTGKLRNNNNFIYELAQLLTLISLIKLLSNILVIVYRWIKWIRDKVILKITPKHAM